jgi:hypothetical protein
MNQEQTQTQETKRRGRPVIEGSKRQAVLIMREEKRAQGIEVKRGRPKQMLDIEVELEEDQA